MDNQNFMLTQPQPIPTATTEQANNLNFHTKKIKQPAGSLSKREQRRKMWTIRKRKALTIIIPLLIASGIIAFFSYKTNAEIDLLATGWDTPAKVNAIEQKVLAGENLSVEEQVWYILDKEYKFTLKEKIKALAIIQCESGFDQYAINKNTNGSLDLGLWQINEPSHKSKGLTRACAFDIACATKFAIEQIYLPQGNWNAWVCAR
jgi:hypothetical protein